MNFIKSFWGNIQKFQSFVGTFLFLILMLFVTAMVVSALLFDGSESDYEFANGALVIDFRGALVEQRSYSDDPFEQLMAGDYEANTLLRDVVKAIDLAKEDDNVELLVLDFEQFAGAYPSKLHYIGQKIAEFKESGKKVVSYGSIYDQSAYLLASFSDEIYLDPQGATLLYGYGGYQTYFLGFLEKIKAEVQLFRVGEYKSAMEPFVRSDMSDEAREANLELYSGLWDDYIDVVAKQREIDPNTLRAKIENADELLVSLSGDIGQLALQNSLVDGLMTREEWFEYMVDQVGHGADEQSLNQMGFRQYLLTQFDMAELDPEKDIVAVLYAYGTIMDGDQPQGTVGGETLSRQLRDARYDDQVKAVVLRVDSPGGSAFASELIRQEVLLLKEAGKPVIASMGSLAASGGYWISANADEIWAAPTTITGSIGIFGAVPNIEGTLAEIGITTDGVGTTSLLAPGVIKPLPDKLKIIIQSNIENGYDRFLELVAEGRGMTTEQVDEIAQGRVWSGRKAQELGLVDSLGGLDLAIDAAASRAEISDYKVVHWEDEIPFELQVIAKLMGNGQIEKIAAARSKNPELMILKKIKEKLSLFNMMNDPNHAYVLCVECIGYVNSDF